VHLTPDKLFSYATLKLQNPKKAARATFIDTMPLFQSLKSIHGVYLQFHDTGLSTDATNEDLRDLSELIGIACGVASAVDALGVNPNRFARLHVTGKRLDFEFQCKTRKCYLEVKGTTNKYKKNGIGKDIKFKKSKQAGLYDEAFGAVTIYGNPTQTGVMIVDPPASSTGTGIPFEASVALILRHYQPYMSACLIITSFHEWLAATLNTIDSTGVLPQRSPPSRPQRRVTERIPGAGEFGGTLFDQRIGRAAVRRYRSFEEATEKLGNKSTFMGIHVDVLETIADRNWEALTQLNWKEIDRDGVTMLPSGVVTMDVDLGSENESALKRMFDLQRQQAERAREV
jgi:hypothetical protein